MTYSPRQGFSLLSILLSLSLLSLMIVMSLSVYNNITLKTNVENLNKEVASIIAAVNGIYTPTELTQVSNTGLIGSKLLDPSTYDATTEQIYSPWKTPITVVWGGTNLVDIYVYNVDHNQCTAALTSAYELGTALMFVQVNNMYMFTQSYEDGSWFSKFVPSEVESACEDIDWNFLIYAVQIG